MCGTGGRHQCLSSSHAHLSIGRAVLSLLSFYVHVLQGCSPHWCLFPSHRCRRCSFAVPVFMSPPFGLGSLLMIRPCPTLHPSLSSLSSLSLSLSLSCTKSKNSAVLQWLASRWPCTALTPKQQNCAARLRPSAPISSAASVASPLNCSPSDHAFSLSRGHL